MVIRVKTDYQLKDPRVMTVLFSDTRMAVVWLLVRCWLGWLWLEDGRQKITDAAWMGDGRALRAHWERVVAPDGALASGWYGDAIRLMVHHQWYGWLGAALAVSEVIVGVALILGLLTGLATLAGSLLTFTLLLPGAALANPFAFVLALGLIAAWKVAGYIGLDAFVLPWLGAPWHMGAFWKRIRPRRRPTTVAV